jgi:hypothetical protein
MASLRLELVATARLNGHTWTEIARALATSPTAPACDSTRTRQSPTRAGPTTPEPVPCPEVLRDHEVGPVG